MKRFVTILSAMLLAAILILTSCRTKTYLPTQADIRADFIRALADAQQPNEQKVSHTLMPVREDDPALEWIDVDGRKMVLMCKMIDQPSLSIYANTDTFRLPAKNGYWVSLPADWKRRADLFEGLDSVASRFRMVQMLGLWPECDYDMVVEFYVDAASLFRPSYDPSITTTTSPSTFPDWADENYTVGDTNFRQWFARQQQSAYLGEKACPWAQLGYSYDWHHGAPREGISEYIAVHGALMKVKTREGAWTFIKKLKKRR